MKVKEIISLHESVVKGIANRYIKWKKRHDNLTKQKTWDNMSDSDLKNALHSAEEIMAISNKKRRIESLGKMQHDARIDLDQYILPQMLKREMPTPKIASTIYNGIRMKKDPK